jgi:hypothetical protein
VVERREAGEERRVRRDRPRRRRDRLAEEHAAGGELLEARRPVGDLALVVADDVGAHRVVDDDDDVGRPRTARDGAARPRDGVVRLEDELECHGGRSHQNASDGNREPTGSRACRGELPSQDEGDDAAQEGAEHDACGDEQRQVEPAAPAVDGEHALRRRRADHRGEGTDEGTQTSSEDHDPVHATLPTTS